MNRAIRFAITVGLAAASAPHHASAQALGPSSRDLVHGQVRHFLEISSLTRLRTEAQGLPMPRLLRDPGIRSFLEARAAQDAVTWRVWQRTPDLLAKLEAASTRGLMVAKVNPRDFGLRASICRLLVTSSKKRSEARALADALHGLRRAKRAFERRLPVPDTPITMRVSESRRQSGRRRGALMTVVGPRKMANLVVDGGWFRQALKVDSPELARRVAASVGVLDVDRGKDFQAGAERDMSGVLARLGDRFGGTDEDPELRGIQCLLESVDGELRERIELYVRPTRTSDSVLEILRPNPKASLADCARFVPADSLGAAQLSVDKASLEKWFDFVDAQRKNGGAMLALPVDKFSELLPPARDGIETLTLAMLAPSGTPLPEPLLILDRDGPKDPAKAAQACEQIARKIAGFAFAGRDEDIRFRTRAGKHPHCFFKFPRARAGSMEMMLLGGGYLTVMRAFDRWLIGFSPRTLRSCAKKIDEGKVLARDERFQSFFGAAKRRRMEMWIDWRKAGDLLRKTQMPLQLVIMGFGEPADGVRALATVLDDVTEEEDAEPEPLEDKDPLIDPPKRVMRLPRIDKLIGGFGPEVVYSEAADFGLVLHHRGALCLSPIGIGVVDSFAAISGALHPLFDRGDQ